MTMHKAMAMEAIPPVRWVGVGGGQLQGGQAGQPQPAHPKVRRTPGRLAGAVAKAARRRKRVARGVPALGLGDWIGAQQGAPGQAHLAGRGIPVSPLQSAVPVPARGQPTTGARARLRGALRAGSEF
jgi:hypothetical protein